MARFTAKVLLFMCTLLFGILLGIHQAELGILALGGMKTDVGIKPLAEEQHPPFEAQHPSIEDADDTRAETDEEVYITKIDGHEVETAVVGRALDLEEKQKKWEQRNHHNKYSYLGNQIGDVVYSVSEKGAQWFVQQLDKIL